MAVFAYYLAANFPAGTQTREALEELCHRLLESTDILCPEKGVAFVVPCNPLGRTDADPRMAVILRAQQRTATR
jgi:hypothetical protein